MRKGLLRLFLSAGVAWSVSASTGWAATEASAVATVRVTVAPNVAVTAAEPVVHAGTVQTGDFAATVRFHVNANRQMVSLCVQASDMHRGLQAPKDGTRRPAYRSGRRIANRRFGNLFGASRAGDPDGGPVRPIPLKISAPAIIAPAAAEPTAARWNGPGQALEGLPIQATETVTIHGSRVGRFDQDVDVTVTWTQDDPAKPPGSYSAKVKLTVLLLP